MVGNSQSGKSPDLIAVVEEGRRLGCATLAISNVAGPPLAAVADHTIALRGGQERSIAAPVPLAADMPEWLSPMAAIVPGQVLAFHLSRLRGFDPDQPRGLKKVTTTT